MGGIQGHIDLEGDPHNSSCALEEYTEISQGQKIEVVWRRWPSEFSHDQGLRGYRVSRNSVEFASMPKGSVTLTCNPHPKEPGLKEFCHNRLEFHINTTHITLKMSTLSSNFSVTLTYIFKGAIESSRNCDFQDKKMITVLPEISTASTRLSVQTSTGVMAGQGYKTSNKSIATATPTPGVMAGQVNKTTNRSVATVTPTVGDSTKLQHVIGTCNQKGGDIAKGVAVPVAVVLVLIALSLLFLCFRRRCQSQRQSGAAKDVEGLETEV